MTNEQKDIAGAAQNLLQILGMELHAGPRDIVAIALVLHAAVEHGFGTTLFHLAEIGAQIDALRGEAKEEEAAKTEEPAV